MSQRRAAKDPHDSLQVEIIDDLGRVLQTVYVDDLAGKSVPSLPRQGTGERHRRASDD